MKRSFLAWLIMATVSGCTPTIQIAVPSEPIEINLNIKIEHQIRIEVGRDLAELFDEESDIF